MLSILILIRILFATSMIFIIGYVFGNFSKRKSLTTITKVAAITVIVLFIAANGTLMRSRGWQRDGYIHYNNCDRTERDSTKNWIMI